ncbi:MAG: hypothetical protein HYS12_07715 [Planctomycetes bacterium]|nr:hypothetical protein [Planctomycetota bacterium]
MREVLLALGRGLVKVLISLLIGTGAGMLALGIAGRDKPDLWQRGQRGPTPEVLLGIGVGLLTAGAVMAILFMFSRRRAPETNRGESRLLPPRERADAP